MEEFERELRQTFRRRPAPTSLKRGLMEYRRKRYVRPLPRLPFLSRGLAASLVSVVLIVLATLGGGFVWRNAEEYHRGEVARQQVLTALRITNHALNHMNQQLATHGRANQE
jgi:hypothetical protein